MTDSGGLSHLKITPHVNYSCCETDINKMKFGHIWTIKNFSYLQEKNGERLESSTFSASENAKHKWHLILYPGGDSEESKAYVSMFLVCELPEPKTQEISVAFEFSIFNSRGRKKVIRKIDRHVFTADQEYKGFSRYTRRHYVMNLSNGLLPNDQLTICCEVIVMLGKPQNTTKLTNAVFGNYTECARLPDDLECLTNNKDFSDVIFVAEDKELYAHKALLTARSTVFAAMFRHDMKENRLNRVVISDIDYSALEELIRFIYTGKIPDMDDQMAMKLLSAADKYALEGLKAFCDQTLSTKMTAENVAQLIPLANLHNCSHLKARLIEFVKFNTNDKVVNELWKLMIMEHPELIALIARAFEEKNQTAK